MAVKKGLVISVTGKGGSGKTVLTALMLKLLLKHNGRRLLVVDADPSTNLPDALATPVGKTVGMVATELRRKISGDEIPPEMDKKSLLEGLVLQVLMEKPEFDLLAMGRTEGEGCYCLVNNLLTEIIDTLSKNYDLTLMDMEAGLEHLSRRTARDVDIMFITTEPSRMGLQTAKRIRDLTEEVHVKCRKIYLVGNMFPPTAYESLQKEAEALGIELIGVIPTDSNVADFNLAGKSLLALPDNSPAVMAVQRIMETAGLLQHEVRG